MPGLSRRKRATRLLHAGALQPHRTLPHVARAPGQPGPPPLRRLLRQASTTPPSSPSSTCSAARPRPASFPSPNSSRCSTTASATPPARSPSAVPHSAAETARMILSYAQQTAAGAIRLRAVEGNIWVRFLSHRSHLDLVFEVASPLMMLFPKVCRSAQPIHALSGTYEYFISQDRVAESFPSHRRASAVAPHTAFRARPHSRPARHESRRIGGVHPSPTAISAISSPKPPARSSAGPGSASRRPSYCWAANASARFCPTPYRRGRSASQLHRALHRNRTTPAANLRLLETFQGEPI